MRMLVVFRKIGAMRFIGHLDLQRAMQRALRRSGLPAAYSQGFSPHLMLSFAAPLSVGVTGEREIMEVPLQGDVGEEPFLRQLNAALPEGLRALRARLLPDEHPAAMARLFAAQYTIKPQEGTGALLGAVPGFMKRDSIPYLRRTKSGEKMGDLRPLIYNLIARDGCLLAALAQRESGTAKPDALIQALADYAGIAAPRCLVTRTALLDERFVPLEDA